MKKKIIFLMILFVTGIIFNCCKKNDSSTSTTPTKTTGRLYAIPHFSTFYNFFGCCSDSTTGASNIHVILKTESGTILNSISATNNATVDLGELNPGNYKVYANGAYTAIANNSGLAPCGNCFGGTISSTTPTQTIQIVAGEDQTVNCTN